MQLRTIPLTKFDRPTVTAAASTAAMDGAASAVHARARVSAVGRQHMPQVHTVAAMAHHGRLAASGLAAAAGTARRAAESAVVIPASALTSLRTLVRVALCAQAG